MNTKILFLHALSPVHSGTGQSVDVIDLPIAREKVTNWPFLPGSAVKGVLRDVCIKTVPDAASHLEVFGPDAQNTSDSAGQVAFTDAHILCFPVRSFLGTFAWISCPAVLNRFFRDYQISGGTPVSFPTVARTADSVTCSGSVNKDTETNKIYLEDLDLSISEQNADEVAGFIADQVFAADDWKDAFKQRFIIISDDMFTSLTETATEVAARIKMEEEEKVVSEGGLWYEESVPPETIFWSILAAMPLKNNTADKLFLYITKQQISPLQIGGSASVGKGLMRAVIDKEELK